MKQIISFSEENLDINILETLPNDEDCISAFRSCVLTGIEYDLNVDRKEAESILEDNNDDSVHFDVYGVEKGYDGYATISYGDYNDYLRMMDVPDLPNKDYIMLITYSFDTDYVSVACSSESEAMSVMESYFQEEKDTVYREQGYIPKTVVLSDTERALVYFDETYSDEQIDADNYQDHNHAIYKVIKADHHGALPKMEKSVQEKETSIPSKAAVKKHQSLVYYEKEIFIPQKTAERIHEYLNECPETEESCFGEEDTYIQTVKFEDGKQMDIKLCGIQYEDGEPNIPWTEAILFDSNGAELCSTEPGDDYLGDWELQADGCNYLVHVKAEKKTPSLTTAGEEKLEVQTTAGILRAYKSCDPGQPGICVMLQPAGCEEEIDVAFVSVYEDIAYQTFMNERSVDVCIMTYADATSEDYTSKEIIRREDILTGMKKR